ncbi:MAG TPA: hypothetical protein VJ785_12870 [Anaerolineales bacterium]|nr:hypothetical protein [Anaerolineales bacterium]
MKTYGARQWFIATAKRMKACGYRIDTRRKWLTRGFLIWKLEPS